MSDVKEVDQRRAAPSDLRGRRPHARSTAAVDRRRLGDLQEARGTLQTELARLQRAYSDLTPEPAAPEAPPPANAQRDVRCAALVDYLGADARALLGHQPRFLPEKLQLPGPDFLDRIERASGRMQRLYATLLDPARMLNRACFDPASALLLSSVLETTRTQLAVAMRRLRRLLRFVSRAIRDVLRLLAEPDHSHTIVSKERPWYLLHGARPPRLLVSAARSIRFRAVDPQKPSGALAA